MKKGITIIPLLFLFFSLGCSYKTYKLDNSEIILTSKNKHSTSTTVGNLITTAIAEIHDLDIVFYPSDLLKKNQTLPLRVNMSSEEIKRIQNFFPEDIMDQFLVGTMKGSRITKFVEERVEEVYRADLQVHGIKYDAHFIGGMGSFSIALKNGHPIEKDKYYKVALSNYFYFSGATFPGYKFRNSMNSGLNQQDGMISARKSLTKYLNKIRLLPDFNEPRLRVVKSTLGEIPRLKISEIQGAQHHSPFRGYITSVRGIVTAASALEWYPRGFDIYIQSKVGDGKDTTSEAIYIHLDDEAQKIKIGDEVEFVGTIYEQKTSTGLSRTSMFDVTKIVTISKDNLLPEPVVLGVLGRKIPDRLISTYKGDLNDKKYLDLKDGIDFFESLEGMRIAINNPRVLGFRGGMEDSPNVQGKPKNYLSLYLKADGMIYSNNATSKGGMIVNTSENDYNPEIIPMVTNHLGKDPSSQNIYNVGEIIEGTLFGILIYEKNLFGDGQFVFVLPEKQEALKNESSDIKKVVDFTERPITTLVGEDNQLTVATFNVENLGATQKKRLVEIGRSISVNMKCPDILSLVEIQDFNSSVTTGSSSGKETINRLIKKIKCPDANYMSVNIDPVLHSEGGQPGGNIRVSMIYNKNRVDFSYRRVPHSLSETVIRADGNINFNPGRVYPNDPAFNRTRKSIVAQFSFRGEKIFIIGNHFNSKLGDSNRWSANQPVALYSDIRRSKVAEKIHDFVELIIKKTQAHVIVLGDFNALIDENSMRVLAGRHMKNLMLHNNLIPVNERYTTNYNGNSQPLDYIFASYGLLNKSPELEILHINSDYMGRISDHDPLVARFTF